MTNKDKQFISNVYSKLLEGYFDLDSLREAYKIITDLNPDQANSIKLRRTVAGYVNTCAINGESLTDNDDKSLDNKSLEDNAIDSTETSTTTTDAIEIDNATHKEEIKPKAKKSPKKKAKTKK